MKETRTKITKQSGFTIIELMIATTVFSIVLLVVSTGIIQIGRQYYKNIISSRTQSVARSTVDELSRTAQLIGSGAIRSCDATRPPPDGCQDQPVRSICFSGTRYTYVIDQPVTGGNHALYADSNVGQSGTCTVNTAFTGGRELLGENMRLLKFETGVSGEMTNIDITIAFGDNDLLTHYNNDGTDLNPDVEIKDGLCRTGVAGSSFCATAGLSVSVKSRTI